MVTFSEDIKRLQAEIQAAMIVLYRQCGSVDSFLKALSELHGIRNSLLAPSPQWARFQAIEDNNKSVQDHAAKLARATSLQRLCARSYWFGSHNSCPDGNDKCGNGGQTCYGCRGHIENLTVRFVEFAEEGEAARKATVDE